MSGSEDEEGGVPPSSSTLSEGHERTEQERADSPEPSSVSTRSDRSTGDPTAFNLSDLIPKQRAGSPAPSCQSLKSDRSKDFPPLFSGEPGPSDTRQRAGSPAPSCQSLKSDRSKDFPPLFSGEPGPSDTRQRAGSPAPSCQSVESDRSKDFPPLFSGEPGPSDTRDQQETSEVHTELDSIFRHLEENIFADLKKELKKFQEVLRTNNPECFESQAGGTGRLTEKQISCCYGPT
ncbi:hypothetical protein CgunFtcFv8_018949 [Champsocephalus gunnari]|uniref:Uncharacterized protein n=1 Tax=Champsocephalus gunnari TaxID=52237 RepID=A0AAN8DGV7_CHAGU|nr:hypothetical protein CgunFtcFv8_018949 [Champsocephalus gunnari]